jgi:hypothetical protein
MPGDLARFQDAFARALLAPEAEPPSGVAVLTVQPAFAVYRNTVMKGCIDALQANYPAVARLVGEEWFRAAAARYAREALPAEPTLLRYGQSFADFLARFEPAAEFPYLPGVARLDRLWTEAHSAADDVALEPAAIARLTTAELSGVILHPHAAARWAWFEEAPVFTIWSRNRSDSLSIGDIDWRPEGVLLVRPGGAVEWQTLDAAGCAFLDACAAGRTLGSAARAAIKTRADVDLAQLMSTLLACGAFGRMTFINDRQYAEDQQ